MDELTYRILEPEYGPRSKRFEPVQDATEEILRSCAQAGRARRRRDRAEAPSCWPWRGERPAERLAAIKRRFSEYLLVNLMEDRQKAYVACKNFIADHPTSRFLPSVLFMQARALDTRMDELKFSGENVRCELYTDFPHVQSEPVWTSLLTAYPDSPLAVAARLRVAQLRLRRGDAEGALTALGPPETTPHNQPSTDTQPATRRFLHATTPESTLDFEPEPYLFEAERLRELILTNWERTAEPGKGVEPLAGPGLVGSPPTGIPGSTAPSRRSVLRHATVR